MQENNNSQNNAQAVIDRSAQRIRDLTELMGASNQFTTSMNMFGKETEGFDDESELEESAARKRDDENMFGAQNISI